jgi:hypothetical protein
MAGTLAELAERYFQVTMDASPFEATAYGVHGWDAEVPDLSEAAEAETDRRLADLQRRLEGPRRPGSTTRTASPWPCWTGAWPTGGPSWPPAGPS